MEQGVVFVVYDESGNVFSTLSSQDVPKKLPQSFQLKALGKKKGVKPSVFLFKSAEMTPKLSTWLYDWSSFPMDERHWEPKGFSVIKTLATPVDNSKFKDIFDQERPSRKSRADCFLALSNSDQAEFARLSSRDQINLLCVSKKMEKQFTTPGFGLTHLIKYVKTLFFTLLKLIFCFRYAEHISTQKQRRQKEHEEKRAKEIAAIRAENRTRLALRDDHEDFLDGYVSTLLPTV